MSSLMKAPSLPPPPKPKVMLTPIKDKNLETADSTKKKGRRSTILTSTSGLINDNDNQYNPSLLG